MAWDNRVDTPHIPSSCKPSLMAASVEFIARLRAVAGRRHVLTGAGATRQYTNGYRFGSGAAAAVVRPASLVEMWRALQICVEFDTIVIVQAANTDFHRRLDARRNL